MNDAANLRGILLRQRQRTDGRINLDSYDSPYKIVIDLFGGTQRTVLRTPQKKKEENRSKLLSCVDLSQFDNRLSKEPTTRKKSSWLLKIPK